MFSHKTEDVLLVSKFFNLLTVETKEVQSYNKFIDLKIVWTSWCKKIKLIIGPLAPIQGIGQHY